MKIPAFITHIIRPHVGGVIGSVGLSLVAHAVAIVIAIADTGIIGKINAQIATAQGEAGAEKRTFVVNAVLDDVVAFVADPSKAAADVVDFAHEPVQAVYDDAVSTTAGEVASLIVARAAARWRWRLGKPGECHYPGVSVGGGL